MTKHHPKQQYALLLLIIDVGIQTTEIIIPEHKSIFLTAIYAMVSCQNVCVTFIIVLRTRHFHI